MNDLVLISIIQSLVIVVALFIIYAIYARKLMAKWLNQNRRQGFGMSGGVDPIVENLDDETVNDIYDTLKDPIVENLDDETVKNIYDTLKDPNNQEDNILQCIRVILNSNAIIEYAESPTIEYDAGVYNVQANVYNDGEPKTYVIQCKEVERFKPGYIKFGSIEKNKIIWLRSYEINNLTEYTPNDTVTHIVGDLFTNDDPGIIPKNTFKLGEPRVAKWIDLNPNEHYDNIVPYGEEKDFINTLIDYFYSSGDKIKLAERLNKRFNGKFGDLNDNFQAFGQTTIFTPTKEIGETKTVELSGINGNKERLWVIKFKVNKNEIEYKVGVRDIENGDIIYTVDRNDK